jgi:hypothetical protein
MGTQTGVGTRAKTIMVAQVVGVIAMDPLPFLFMALLIFGSLQAGVYFAWRSTREKPPITGSGEVDGDQFIEINKETKK